MVISHTIKKAYLLIEDVRVRRWIAVFMVWLVAVVIWNYGYPQATPFADVLVAVILSLAVTEAHSILTKLRKGK